MIENIKNELIDVSRELKKLREDRKLVDRLTTDNIGLMKKVRELTEENEYLKDELKHYTKAYNKKNNITK